MKLYIKQKVFSWNDRFNVYNENENIVFTAEGEIFTWGKKLYLYNQTGTEAAFLEQQLLTFLPRYNIYINGDLKAIIIRKLSFFNSLYTVEGPNWQVIGDFWNHEYEITSVNYKIAEIHKQWLTWGDCYELDIAEGADTVLALSVALVIDAIMAQSK